MHFKVPSLASTYRQLLISITIKIQVSTSARSLFRFTVIYFFAFTVTDSSNLTNSAIKSTLFCGSTHKKVFSAGINKVFVQRVRYKQS